jgi:hypothetical protein
MVRVSKELSPSSSDNVQVTFGPVAPQLPLTESTAHVVIVVSMSINSSKKRCFIVINQYLKLSIVFKFGCKVTNIFYNRFIYFKTNKNMGDK